MMESTSTYQAVQAVAPGRLELVRKPIRNPGPGEVRIRVEACGVCHSDSGTVDGMFPIDWPRVPGHEAVGRIDALGPHVRGWAAGQRVGVGFLGGSCGHCDYCRGGDLVNCRNQEFTGIHRDGGYAEMLIARATGLIFSREQKTIDRFIGQLSFGGGAVNQVNVHLFVETMPFGGVGPSGMGHYYGKHGFDMMTHAKSMLISLPDVAIDHLFPPYTSEKNADLKQWFEY
jgi:D-arabinose 1-dehydrogenase-like Zn-dependent alcohol dehydrogenase